MPLLQTVLLSDQSAWALWQIEEDLDQLVALSPQSFVQDQEFHSITHPQKKQEWLASRLLVHHLTNHFELLHEGIKKDSYGKPHLVGIDWHISIAHCYPLAVAAINKSSAIGIDIEKPRAQLQRISKKFLSNQELQHAGSDVNLLCRYWTAKEALYKIYGRKKLIFKEDILVKSDLDSPSNYRGTVNSGTEIGTYQIQYQLVNQHMVALSR